jgi:hypothetical protein
MGDSGLAVKVFDGVAVANPALPLTDFKMVITGGTALYAIDDLIIEQLAPFADPEIALRTPFVEEGQVTIEPVGTPNSTWSVWRALAPTGPWANAGSLTLDETGTGQYLDSDPPQGSAFYYLELTP